MASLKDDKSFMRTPGGVLVNAFDVEVKGLGEQLLKPLIPESVPKEVRERGMRDLFTALGNFNKLLDKKLTTRQLSELVKSTNAFDEYRIKNNLGVTVVFDGRVHESYPGKKPLLISYTEKGEIGDTSILDGMLDEGVRLAEAMQRKNVLWDTPWDGGKTIIASEGSSYRAVTTVYGEPEVEDLVLAKGGVRFTRIGEGQESQSQDDKSEIVCDWVSSSINAGVLGKKYIAGPDMNMSKDMMSVIVDQAFKTAKDLDIKDFPLPTTSRDTSEGGFDHFKWSVTSRGVVEGMLCALRNKEFMDRVGVKQGGGLSVIIQGFGDVGSGILKILTEEYGRYGIKIVGVSDRHGAIYDSKGLDVKELLTIRQELERAEEEGTDKDAMHIAEMYRGKVEKKWMASKGDDVNQLLTQEATILMPAAGRNAITLKNIGQLKVKMIFEGANNSVERGLEGRLQKMGVAYFRGELENGGGIYTSTDEFFHYLMEGEKLKEHVDGYRTHVLEGITDLAVSNTRMVLEKWLSSPPDTTITDVVYGYADEMLRRRTLRMANITPAMLERAGGDVERSGGKMPKKIALTIAASESAREFVAYSGQNQVELMKTIQAPYDSAKASDVWSDYVDKRICATYTLGKLRNTNNTELLQTLLEKIEAENDHPKV
ncbi:MAG TPA: Glu/Leu/Phe/Val dehydrogenase, partial [Candidatus Altiarchaeales archaeon]|nr:Glu/Leu/Phe/Val dehydrogenase [Candidatus Altiarchaeales archaeon]